MLSRKTWVCSTCYLRTSSIVTQNHASFPTAECDEGPVSLLHLADIHCLWVECRPSEGLEPPLRRRDLRDASAWKEVGHRLKHLMPSLDLWKCGLSWSIHSVRHLIWVYLSYNCIDSGNVPISFSLWITWASVLLKQSLSDVEFLCL